MKTIITAVIVSFFALATPIQAKAANPMITMETSLGTMTIELYPDKAPLTVKNFLAYVDAGFFDGLIFHRVIPNFVIQGGGFKPGMVKVSTRAPIKNEAANGLDNLRGTLSMARTGMIDSATSQFFINLRDNASLDHHGNGARSFGYAVFAKVIKGMDVLDRIAHVPTTSKGFYRDVPRKDVVIIKVVRK